MTWSNNICFFFQLYKCRHLSFGLKEMLKEQAINKCHTGHFSITILPNETFCQSVHDVAFNLLVLGIFRKLHSDESCLVLILGFFFLFVMFSECEWHIFQSRLFLFQCSLEAVRMTQFDENQTGMFMPFTYVWYTFAKVMILAEIEFQKCWTEMSQTNPFNWKSVDKWL